MAFKTEDFKSRFNPQRTDLFECMILPPTLNTNFDGDSQANRLRSSLAILAGERDNFIFDIESCELPAKNIQAVDHRYYGAIRKIATAATYVDMTLTFLLGEDQRQLDFFHTYMDLVSGNVRKAPNVSSTAFEPSYYDDYKSTVRIITYSKEGEKNRQVDLIDAYPITLSSTPLNWGQTAIGRLSVTFTYRYFTDQSFITRGLQSLQAT
jgi:hypothetical protein